MRTSKPKSSRSPSLSATQSGVKYWVCGQWSGNNENAVVVGPFAADSSVDVKSGKFSTEEVGKLTRDTFQAGNFGADCNSYDSKEEAVRVNGWLKDRLSKFKYFPDWRPSSAASQSTAQVLTLDFEPGDGSGFLHARRGYRHASIKLNYRFLLCANEIQMAYALDRKSLEHSQDYVARFNGLNPNTMVPNSEPPIPMTVPLAVKIVQAVPGTPYVATIRDGTAGEALGMGCFTGQTARVGFVAKLIGPQATRPQIKAYIDTLRADEITPGASLGFALINPDVPAPPAPSPRPRVPVRRKPH
jgi:hypothetical protein